MDSVDAKTMSLAINIGNDQTQKGLLQVMSSELTPLLPPSSKPDPGSSNAPEKPFKLAQYVASKSSGQAATNLALITSNATQLKNIIDDGPDRSYYYFFMLTLIISIVLQVVVGFFLMWLVAREAKLHVSVNKGTRKTKKIGKIVLFMVFFVSIINVIMNAFAVKFVSSEEFQLSTTAEKTKAH